MRPYFDNISLGWTVRPQIQWIVSVIGLVLVMTGNVTIMLSMFGFLGATYPEYGASLFAANDAARSGLAAAAVLFSRPVFINLGINWGCTLLALLAVVCCFLYYGLWLWGDKLRAHSRFAAHR